MLLFIPTYYYYYHLHYYYLYYHYLLIITLMLEHGQDLFLEVVVALKRAVGFFVTNTFYLDVVYFVTAFVPSLTACFANSPGRRSRTAVCTSRLEIVDFLL